MAVDRDVIEHQLDKVVAKFMEHISGREIMPGWRTLGMFNLEFAGPDQGRVPILDSGDLNKLLAMAEKSQDAFDAAGYLAGFYLAARRPMSDNLTLFASRVLAGELRRPAQRGRPVSKGKLRSMYQYALVMFLHKRADLPIARNRENSGKASFSACDAVADAFTRGGIRTTFEQVASIVYDKAHADLREAAKALSILDFNDFEDYTGDAE